MNGLVGRERDIPFRWLFYLKREGGGGSKETEDMRPKRGSKGVRENVLYKKRRKGEEDAKKEERKTKDGAR
jgi:hypothetical protein